MTAIDYLAPLVMRAEGCRLAAYLCPAGVPTIGWGSTGPDIRLGMVWTQEQADDRLQRDLEAFLHGAARLVPTVADDPRRLAAAADFAYNLGLTRLASSTFRRRLLARDWPGAQREVRRWVCGGGRKLPGLVARRDAEAALLS